MRVVFGAAQETFGAQVLEHFLARVEAIEPFEFLAGGRRHPSALVDDLELRKLVALSGFVVALVV